MARVIALIPDLLFGSRVQADLVRAGHEVELVGTSGAALAGLAGATVLVVDLTADPRRGLELVEELNGPARPRTLGFYAHVEAATRQRAERAGFDLVVPRSRMAREGAVLVARLADG